jgi:hypothetical protein
VALRVTERGANQIQQQIDDPAAPDMWPLTPAVAEDVGVSAAGVLQGVGEDRSAVEGTVVVDRLGQLGDSTVLRRQPFGT